VSLLIFAVSIPRQGGYHAIAVHVLWFAKDMTENHLASVYAKEKNWKQAIEAAKHAVDMRVQRYGP
jgi:hypothetical protein